MTSYDNCNADSISGTDGFSYDDIELYMPQVCGNNAIEGNEVCSLLLPH